MKTALDLVEELPLREFKIVKEQAAEVGAAQISEFLDSLAVQIRRKLTPREFELLTLKARNFSQKEMAAWILRTEGVELSLKTVNVHLHNAHGKIGTSDQAEIMARWLRAGFITPDEIKLTAESLVLPPRRGNQRRNAHHENTSV